MRHFEKIAEGIDVGPLNAELAAHPELWNAHPDRKAAPGSPHAGMSDIWLRFAPPGFLSPATRWQPFIPVWYPAAKHLPAAKRIAFDLMAKVEGEMLCGVLITRIPPGGGIASHVDSGWHVASTEKLYVSLKSEPGARFICEEGGDETLEPKEGTVWKFDNRKPHRVENASATDRVTLIVCIRTQLFGRP